MSTSILTSRPRVPGNFAPESTAAETGPTAAPLPTFSNDQIASFLSSGYWGGIDYHWNLGNSGTAPQGGVLTYNVSGLSAARAGIADRAFTLYETVLGIDFVKTTGTADITVDDSDPGTAYETHSAIGSVITSAFVNVSADWSGGGSTVGDYVFQTFLHEIGHALGLGHAGNYNGSANYVTDTTDPNYGNNSNHYLNDSWQASIMSYFDQIENTKVDASGAYLISPMVADWIALGNKYGISSTAFSGNTTWGFNTNITSTIFANLATYANHTAFTIIDSGGTDTVDFSGFSANQRVNLNAESISDVGGLTGNMIIARGSVIENAVTGAGSDVLTGNSVNNTLNAGAGADSVNAGIGNDIVLDTDAINFDTYNGGNGSDTINYSAVTFSGANFVTLNLGTGLASISGGNSETIASFENIVGSKGGETIIGTTGANVIRGAGGRDIMIGGAGNDRFDFDLIADSKVGNAVCDVLQAGGGSNAAFDLPGAGNGDRIDVSTIDANTGASGDQTFIFGGTGAGHIRCINSGTTTQVLAYVNGDSTADFQLNIQDGNVLASAYTAADFIL